MKKTLSGLLLLAFAIGSAHAQSEVFLCVDESGKKEYKNTGLTKGCKKVELPGITTIPAPPKRTAPPVTVKAPNAPSDFPKVDNGTQKARDNDRRQILLDELKAEEQKLANQKQEFNNGEPERRGDERNYAKYQERVAAMKEDIARTEKNIEALKREINNLK
jgi:hypothetical protein